MSSYTEQRWIHARDESRVWAGSVCEQFGRRLDGRLRSDHNLGKPEFRLFNVVRVFGLRMTIYDRPKHVRCHIIPAGLQSDVPRVQGAGGGHGFRVDREAGRGF